MNEERKKGVNVLKNPFPDIQFPEHTQSIALTQ